MNLTIQWLYQLRRWLLRLLKVKTRGVKVMVFNRAGELLLVRNSYGNRESHVFPGGGIRRFEEPAAAALREIREEVGIEAQCLTYVASYHSYAEGKRDSVHLFTAFSEKSPTTDSFEIEEACFFSLGSLPDTVSDATLRRVEEYRATRMHGGLW